jgi:hypothetical protein
VAPASGRLSGAADARRDGAVAAVAPSSLSYRMLGD